MKYLYLWIWTLLTWGCLSPLLAQDTTLTMRPPFDFPIVFSGNFGELRSNHFHGGLDFKTQGAIGKPVHALADGYISRIRVTHGSGYILEVAYENGYTTINRHLEAFVGEVARRVEELQYEQESWEVDITPSPDEYPVKAGEVIAMSGNTGYSFGPHLHLDMLESATGEYVDPLPFFRTRVNDHTAPQATGLMLFPMPGEGVVQGKQTRQAFPAHPERPIEAWGVIGVGIRAFDHMDGVHNRYGVHTVKLEVDGREVFRSVVDRFRYDENPYINSWTCGNYMKSFIEPGNRLRMLHADSLRGLLLIDEARPYRLLYTLSDALGNTSRLRFTIVGRPQDIPSIDNESSRHFRWDKTNYLQMPGMELVVPQGTLYTDAWMAYQVESDSLAPSYTYRLQGEEVPLHKPCLLRIGLRRPYEADSAKYYVAGVSPSGKLRYIGGRYQEGYMEAEVKTLGSYTVDIDTIAPEVKPVQPQQWARTGRIVWHAKDAQTGVWSYRGTIDGEYALFGKRNALSGHIEYKLDPRRVQRGITHTVEMSVTDGCGNTQTARYSFRW